MTVSPDITHLHQATRSFCLMVFAVRYETGDHVSILPSNDPDLVARTLKRIGADYLQWFTIEGNIWCGKCRVSYGRHETQRPNYARDVSVVCRFVSPSNRSYSRNKCCSHHQ